MKKVLFVITQSEFGGAQRFLDTLVTYLSKDKYEILIAIGVEGDDKLVESLKKKGIAVTKVRHLVRNPHPYHDLLAIAELRQLVKTYKPETLFLCSSKAGTLGSIAANFPSKLAGVKVIYRIGGWTFNDPWPQWKRWAWKEIEKRTAKYKDIIIVNNKYDYDQAKKLDIIPRQSLELIHNGLDLSELNFLGREEARAKLLQTTGLLIGCIANFYPAKGLNHLIEAIHILNTKYSLLNAKLVVIGGGELRPKLESLIAKYKLRDIVFLAGRLDGARRHLKAFDVYVQPSVKEGFPWAVLEALAAGLPVLATKVGAVPEIIQDGQNGLLVEPGNSLQLAVKIKELLDNPELRQTLGGNATKTASEKFSITKMVSQIEAVL